MTHGSRYRKLAFWFTASLTILLASSCGPWGVYHVTRESVTGIGSGLIWWSRWDYHNRVPPPAGTYTYFERTTWSPFQLLWTMDPFGRGGGWISLPPLAVVLAITTFGLGFYERRGRRRPSDCHCGYNLTGNTTGRCPECGSAIPIWIVQPSPGTESPK